MEQCNLISNFTNGKIKALLIKLLEDDGIEVRSHEIKSALGNGENLMGVLRCIRINGLGKEGKEVDMNLILKQAPDYTRDKFDVGLLYRREVYAYQNIFTVFDKMQDEHGVPEDKRFKPVPYFGGDDEYEKEFLIMQDMKAINFKMLDKKEPLTYECLLLAVEQMAALHSLSFALKKTDEAQFKEMNSHLSELKEFENSTYINWIKSNMDLGLSVVYDEEHKKKIASFNENILKKVVEIVRADKKHPYTVFCHGDSWINNILFKFDGEKPVEVRLLDWQMIKHSSPVLDIAYLIFSSTDEETRAKHLLGLLELYYENLKAALKRLDCDIDECYPREIYDKHIKEMMPFGLIMAFLTAPIFMSEDDDIVDLEEILKKDEFSMEYLELKNSVSQKRYSDRINGVVRDFVKMGLI